MKSMVIFYRNLLKALSFSLIFICPFVLFTGLISRLNISNYLSILLALLLPFYTVYFYTKNAQKGIAASFCVLSSSLIYFALSGEYLSLVFIVLISVISAITFFKMRISYASSVMFVSLILFSFVLGILHPFLKEYLFAFSSLIKGRGYLFGFINNAYEIFVSGELKDVFYRSAYSKAELINGKIVSGAVNIFKADKTNSVCASYLTGKYFVNITLTLGVFAAVIKSMRDDLKGAFVLTCIVAVLTGDVRLFSLYLLIYNPALYLGYLIAVFIAYLIPPLINLNIGITDNGSIVELFKYANSLGYFLVTGIVLFVFMYFMSKLVISRFKLSYGRYYPKKVRKIISSLGNEDNIESIEYEDVIVKNPNLVNILTLECDIHGNKISLNSDDFELIKEYF